MCSKAESVGQSYPHWKRGHGLPTAATQRRELDRSPALTPRQQQTNSPPPSPYARDELPDVCARREFDAAPHMPERAANGIASTLRKARVHSSVSKRYLCTRVHNRYWTLL